MSKHSRIYKTTKSEIAIVNRRLKQLSLEFDDSLLTKLSSIQDRMEQHRLFYLLLDDRTFQPLKRAIEIIKKQNNTKYIKKTISLLSKSNDPIQYTANNSEIIVFAYYLEKYDFDDSLVIWERKYSKKTNKSVDISLMLPSGTINIEVTGLVENESMRKFFREQFQFRKKFGKLVFNIENPAFAYFITFPDIGFIDLENVDFLPTFINDHMTKFATFVKENRKNGEGLHIYESNGVKASAKIYKLNKLKREYVECGFGWSGFLRDSLRIKSKVVEKSTNQLPTDEINFVYVVNLANMDNDDYCEAMYGQLEVKIGKNGNHKTIYADNGVSHEIEKLKGSPVHGIIKSNFNYFNIEERLVVVNNRTLPKDAEIEAIT